VSGHGELDRLEAGHSGGQPHHLDEQRPPEPAAAEVGPHVHAVEVGLVPPLGVALARDRDDAEELGREGADDDVAGSG
jgi:hypothetical protein